MKVEEIIELFEKYRHGDDERTFIVKKSTEIKDGKNCIQWKIRFVGCPNFIYLQNCELTKYAIILLRFDLKGINSIYFGIRKGRILTKDYTSYTKDNFNTYTDFDPRKPFTFSIIKDGNKSYIYIFGNNTEEEYE